jgi:hypothetical protein
MRFSSHFSAILAAGALAIAGCGGGGESDSSDSDVATPPAGVGAAAETTTFDEADVDAFARGFAREAELVREAQAKARSASTPEGRGAAMQAQWKEQTMPGGAEAAGMPLERYAAVREAITGTLQTLDFQGKIEGPMQLDTSRASPEMRRRLESDAFASLPPSSAAALRSRLEQLAPIWRTYVELTAVGG